ncbi:MAG: sensor histidine kinase [Chloroflexota bacterium]
MILFGRKLSPFRLVAISLYLGVIIAKFAREAANICTKPVLIQNDFLFLGCFAILIGLELWEERHYAIRPPTRDAVFLLVTRIILIEVIRLGDCSFFFGFLYLLPPIIGYWYFRPIVGYLLGIIYFVNYAIRQSGLEPGYEALDEVLIFTIGLIFAFTMANMVRQEEKNRKEAELLLKQLEASQNQVAELAATEERNRLARNIHDSVGHYLTVVGIQLDKAIAYKNIDPAEAGQAVVDAKRAADNALEDVRASVSSLREETSFSLNLALQNLIETNRELPIELELIGEESRYSHAVLTTIFRAVQEGLTNIHKHAQATKVKVKVGLGLKEANLTVEDDGNGFDTENLSRQALNTQAQFGLQGLRERLELVGGKLDVTSNDEQGTSLQITIPRRELMVQ